MRATTRVLQRRPPLAGAAEARRWRHLAGCSAQRAATSPRPPGCWSGGCGCPRACVAGARGQRSPRLAVGAPRRRRDLGGTGRSERPSLLPLLAPLSARRARSGSGSGAGASSSREAGASATRDAAGRSRVMALGVSRRHGKGRRAAWCSAKSAGALWDRSWPKDRNPGCIAKARERAPSGVVQRKISWALWDRSWLKDRNRTAPNYCRRGLTLGQKSPPI